MTFCSDARELQKSRDQKPMALSTEAFAVQEGRIETLRRTQHGTSGAYMPEIADRSIPLSNLSIAEWNRRRQRQNRSSS
ncbi:MAG: hypothetical protein ABJQ08_08635 [Paracoccaceae bacterium]